MALTDIPTEADVVVAGGGPAGACISRLLAGFGYRVVLIEKRRFPRYQIGESLTPSILPALDFVGVREQIEAAGFLRNAGNTVYWGSPRRRIAHYSPDHARRGFQVWREDFDALLLSHARAGGVYVSEGRPVEHVQLASATGVQLSYAGGGRIQADFLIDASGHAGVAAHQGGRRRDPVFQTLALCGYWRNAADPAEPEYANTLIETYPDGLVWSAPLHNGLRNVTLLVDWHLGGSIVRAGLAPYYLSELEKTAATSRLLERAQSAIAPRAFDASLYTTEAFGNERFLLVGDAGLFIDPMSSEGVHKAIASAITGAVVANTILQRPSSRDIALAFYEQRQRQTYDDHYREAVRYYREETRWRDRPFWHARTGVPRPRPTPPGPAVTATGPPISVSALQPAPAVRIERRPVIHGRFVELHDVVSAPHHARGLRFLAGIHVPTLVRIVRQHPAVGQVIATYCGQNTATHPEHVRQVLMRLCQEGVLRPSSPDEIRSG